MSRIVRLNEKQIAFADDIARKRQANAERNGYEGGHGLRAEDREVELQLNIIGARAEVAAWVFLKPIKFHAKSDGADFKGLPDLGDFIDVKRIGSKDHRLIVSQAAAKENPDWAFLAVYGGDHPTYEIIGWIYARKAARDQYKFAAPDRPPQFYVPLSDLRHPDELRHIVHHPEESFDHHCDCGAYGVFGFEGKWYCGAHRDQKMERNIA